MTRTEANQLLDEQKQGIRIYPIVEVTKALWLTGDLGGTLSRSAKPLVDNGTNQGFQGLHMEQSQRD